jgi:hypothetical protein
MAPPILAMIHSELVWAGAAEAPRQVADTQRMQNNRKRIFGLHRAGANGLAHVD